jgi:hypothetical protein
MTQEHCRRLERMYLSAPVNKFYSGITIAISDERAELSLRVDPKYFHAANAIQVRYILRCWMMRLSLP